MRFYGGVEYLLWWPKGAPLSVPLLSTGPDSEPNNGGFLVNSDARVLYGAPYSPALGGNKVQALSPMSGSRLTLGYFIDEQKRYAVELSGFGFAAASGGYNFQSDGSTPARVPMHNNQDYRAGGVGMTVPPLEDGVPVALPNDVQGKANFSNTLHLAGANATGVMNLYRDPSWEISALGGAAYLRLAELFSMDIALSGLSGSEFYGQSGWASDRFGTTNQFFGGTLGGRVRYRTGPFSAELTGLLGVGLSHATIDVSGAFQEFNTPYVTSTPGVTGGLRVLNQGSTGIFAQTGNEGTHAMNRFAVVPEVQLKLGYDITPAARVTVGYDFVFYSNVARPVDQIDRNFNKGLVFQQDPTATAGPSVRYRTTNFYAQGLSLGVTFTF